MTKILALYRAVPDGEQTPESRSTRGIEVSQVARIPELTRKPRV